MILAQLFLHGDPMSDRDANLPGGPGGALPVAWAQRLIGFGESDTPAGSGELALDGHTVAGTAITLDFSGVPSDLVPLIAYLTLDDGGTQVAGEYALSTDGESDLSGATWRIPASGETEIYLYELWINDGNIYIAPDADPGADGFLNYRILYGRRSAGAAAV